MLDTLAFLGAFAAFVYILYWSVKNDGVSSIAEETGLLRLKERGAEPKMQSASPTSYMASEPDDEADPSQPSR